MQDEGIYKAWGRCAPTAELSAWDDNFACYFESKDGINWDRPNLGLVEWNGNKENNLLSLEYCGLQGGTVFKDPSAPPEERYKLVSARQITREEFEGYKKRRPDGWEPRADRHIYADCILAVRGWVSSDGLRWTMLPDPLVVEHCDTHAGGYYDERLEKYVLYTRNWMVGPRAKGTPNDQGEGWLAVGRRSIGRSESADFRNFPLSELIVEPGPQNVPSDVFYDNVKTHIPGAPDQHLMFPAIWHGRSDSTSLSIMSSHDGAQWHFLPGSPILDTASFMQFDGGASFGQSNLIELANGDFALPYMGYNFPHKYPRGRYGQATGYAVWPQGRISAFGADERGYFATVALIAPGTKLRVNAKTKRAGSVRVAVQYGRRGSDIIPGREFENSIPIVGDQPSAPVRWKNADDLGVQPGEPVILLFKLDQAEFYSLEFVQ